MVRDLKKYEQPLMLALQLLEGGEYPASAEVLEKLRPLLGELHDCSAHCVEAVPELEFLSRHSFDQLPVFEDGRTPVCLTEKQYNSIRKLALSAAPTPPASAEPVSQEFTDDLRRSRAKYPRNEKMFDGLIGEVEELRRAYGGDGDIRAEAFDVAVCAYRIATEGDAGGNVTLYTSAESLRQTDDELWDQTISERDHAERVADKLADAIATYFELEIGEHSSCNCPWQNALEQMPDKPAIAESSIAIRADIRECGDIDREGNDL